MCEDQLRRAMRRCRVVLPTLLGNGRLMERFWSKVDKSGECWIWTASRKPLGYGQFGIGGRPVVAHRVAYELLVGPIPAGLELDHLCRNRACVRPDHLEAVTRQENVRRGLQGFLHVQKEACRFGHPFDEHNTVVRKISPRARDCRACQRERGRRYRERLATARKHATVAR